ncbi:ABC transporter substrate-binding protein [Sedimenticola selenatireducens]|uniref:ABC transporter substrate-binding protein n=1 Tax=Sedimenticola selenatireducens TaxID=191960 RepID=A0A2N6D128_9GAMM|nr:ABC transporter substrate-binding protein [Sedimenticola selenatireducens]PLX63394.1 MAG: ABC transporter substrate-binding protein [Sedimenticola selenatireducens]
MKPISMRAILLTLLLCTSGWATADSMKIRMGTEGAYPPFNLIDKNGELAGFDIEIGNALCEAMKADCEWVTSDWDGIIPALLAKKFDTIIASMSITNERKEKVAFTDKYYTTPVRFARAKGTDFEISEKALEGKIVGVQGSTVAENFLRGRFGEIVEVRAYGTQDEANLDLLSGRVDLLLADSFVLGEFLKSESGQPAEFVGPGFTDKKYLGEGIGIAVRKEDTALLEKLNQAIKQIRADGTYARINAKYFDFDVYGE